MRRITKSPESITHPRLREGLFLLACAAAVFVFISLFSYHRSDVVGIIRTMNAGGRVGSWIAEALFDLFGELAYLFSIMLVYFGWLGFRDRFDPDAEEAQLLGWRALGFLAVFLGGGGLISLHLQDPELSFGSGGVIGTYFAKGLILLFSFTGSTLILFALFLIGVTLGTGLSWFATMEKVGQITLMLIDKLGEQVLRLKDFIIFRFSSEDEDEEEEERDRQARKNKSDIRQVGRRKLTRVEPAIHRQERIKIKAAPRQLPLSLRTAEVTGELPSLELLDPPEKPTAQSYSDEDLERLSREVELRLHDFGISVQVVAVHPGPVVTRFEMQLAAGVKASRITSLAKDLARSLSAVSVRIVEVIPGKSYVGLELPNKHREVVRLSEVLASTQYEQARSPISLALGKDIAGFPMVVDLGKMPHLLVAGTTGSGKSVGLNAMLLSMLFKAKAEEVRMIMIDPKMLELSIYEGIPHLLAPVVTDMKEAANALRWCVAEMDRRYRLMAAVGVRNLAGFNQKINEAIEDGEPILDPLWRSDREEEAEALQPLPHIVVVVDEFADMFMVVGKKVEELIARLAQKARAAGIHLILATQRPSVDVITGLIKANIPTRMAFQVSSKIDSRTILDQQGAEQLLGYGDMLYLPPGTGIPVRVHGAFVADHEVHAVVNDLRQRGTPEYIDSVTAGNDATAEVDKQLFGENFEDATGEADALYDQAAEWVIQTRRASISSIQRRFKIGYNRAANLVESMENAGLVSPMESNGNREVLVPEMES